MDDSAQEYRRISEESLPTQDALHALVAQRIGADEALAEDAAWELQRKFLPLAYSIATDYEGREEALTFLDLCQEASIGLMKALNSFDWQGAAPETLKSHAEAEIRRTLDAAVETQGKPVMIPSADVQRIERIERIMEVTAYLTLDNGGAEVTPEQIRPYLAHVPPPLPSEAPLPSPLRRAISGPVPGRRILAGDEVEAWARQRLDEGVVWQEVDDPAFDFLVCVDHRLHLGAPTVPEVLELLRERRGYPGKNLDFFFNAYGITLQRDDDGNVIGLEHRDSDGWPFFLFETIARFIDASEFVFADEQTRLWRATYRDGRQQLWIESAAFAQT